MEIPESTTNSKTIQYENVTKISDVPANYTVAEERTSPEIVTTSMSSYVKKQHCMKQY